MTLPKSILACLVGAAFIHSGALARQELTARGVVFHDENRNGERDDGERGVPQVLVSNGEWFVKTNNRGEYEIPMLEGDGFVFIVKRRGWKLATDEQGLPKFYYAHKPDGSPDDDFIYPGSEPTGPLPESIDFPMHVEAEHGRFRALVIADPQPYNEREVDYYRRDVIAEAAECDADFAIILGDLVGDDLDLFHPLNEAQADLGIPVFNVLGNHDLNFMARTDEHSDETFERVYGPSHYAFQWAGVHFLVLDTVNWKGYQPDEEGNPSNGNYEGGLSRRQLLFVRNYLSRVPTDQLVVMCMHIPLDGPGKHSVPELKVLNSLFYRHPYTLSLSGHMHTQRHTFFGPAQGYANQLGTEHHHYNVGTASGQWWRGRPDERGIPHALMQDGTPNGFALIDFNENTYEITYRGAGMDPDEQIRVFVPEQRSAGADEPFRVFANIFNGSERSEVSMRLDNGEWMTMRREVRPDPFYERIRELEQRDDADYTGIGAAKDCEHLWVTEIPEYPEPGEHLIEVRERDMFGRLHTASTTVEIP